MFWYLWVLGLYGINLIAGLALIGHQKEVLSAGTAVFLCILGTISVLSFWMLYDSQYLWIPITFSVLMYLALVAMYFRIDKPRKIPLYTTGDAIQGIIVSGLIIAGASVLYYA